MSYCPAAISRGGVVRPLAPGLWCEDVQGPAGSCRLHARSLDLLARVAIAMRIARVPSRGPNGISTMWILAKERGAAIDIASRLAVLAVAPANDLRVPQ